MFFTLLVLFSAFLLEAIGTYVSVVGLANLFAYSGVVMVMAVALDIAKVVNVSFLYRHWKEINALMKSYMVIATLVLMLITSTGIFGFLSGEFQKAIAGSSQQTVLIQALTEEQGRLQKRKEEIDKQIVQLPSTNVRGRRQLMQQFGPEVKRLNDRLAEIDVKLPELKVASVDKDTHVGPIIYVAKAFDTSPEIAVKWIILTIIFVFDPLAIALLIAGNFLISKRKSPLTTEVSRPPLEIAIEPEVQQAHVMNVTPMVFEKPLRPEPLPSRIIKESHVPLRPAPKRERVVIKPPPTKPASIRMEADVIKLEKPLMRSSLETIITKDDIVDGLTPSTTKNMYDQIDKDS